MHATSLYIQQRKSPEFWNTKWSKEGTWFHSFENTRANYGGKFEYLGVLNFIFPGLEGQLGLSNRFTFTHDPSPVCPESGKTWITDINVKSQEKVHLMMDPPRICIWGPPNNSIKYQTQFTPKSTRVIHKVCQISLVRCSKCSPDRGRTLLTGWKCRVHKKHHLFGIILGCCT